MASVAICPHCYLQLIVPDGVESDEPVECPTCAKEFGLDQAVLRAIPEVVRRSPVATKTEAPVAESTVPEVAVDETVEVEDLVTETDGQREAAVIDDIKARIEAEIAENGLRPSSNLMLPLELPADAGVESSLAVEPAEEDVAASFQHAETAPESPAEEELPQEFDLAADLDVEAKTQAAEEADEIDEATSEQVVEQAEAEDDVAPGPVESDFARPAATTLADLMPPREEPEVRDEMDEAPGPSFDLPNVPLTPTNGATVEIDPSMSFGPAAETEFELDDVDFEAMPAAEPAADEAAEANEPVFREPEAVRMPAEPFVLPGIPRPRKKRSVVGTLVKTTLGGAVGLSLGYFILLYLLGPEADFLQVAKFVPNAVLPKSFSSSTSQLAEAAHITAPPEKAATDLTDTRPIDNTSREESANVPAGYSEEVKPPAESVATYESPSDDRYGTEPSPLEEPIAEPIADETPQTTVAPLPLRGPTFTIDQLASALEAGKKAQSGLTAGDLSDASVRRTKGMSYAKLCDLAEALTFVDRSAPSVESEQATEGADRLFRATLADAHTRNEVARIAQIWIDSPHRAHGGIFLAGTASGGQIAGDLYEYELTDEDGGKLTLLMQEPLDPLVESSGHPIGVVGSIVDDPAGQIAGYRGTAKRAIWVARAIPLD